MTKKKSAIFSSCIRHLDENKSKAEAEARKKVVEQNGNCLTCHYTKHQCGIFLICSHREKSVNGTGKRVRHYNYCEKFITESDWLDTQKQKLEINKTK